MSESNYKYLTWAAIILVIWVVFSITCSKKDEYETAADGLDLQAVGAVLKKAKDAEEFEKLLNDPNVGVNNLDLDENDLVDFIKVTEYGNESVKGFSLTTETATDQEQEIATIEIEKTSNQEADVQIHGNRQILRRHQLLSLSVLSIGLPFNLLYVQTAPVLCITLALWLPPFLLQVLPACPRNDLPEPYLIDDSVFWYD